MISEETYRIHRAIIYCVVLIFEVFGLFGNINLVVLTVRKKTLQTKYGLILSLLATLHTLCLLFELVDMSFSIAATLSSHPIRRSVCFHVIFSYIFIYSLQTGTMSVLSLDLLIKIMYPLAHRNFRVRSYFVALFLVPVVYGFATVFFGFLYLDDAELQMCNPPSALHPLVNAKWYSFMMVFTLFTLFFYSTAFLLIYLKVRRRSKDIKLIEKKSMKTLKFLICIFLISRFITISLANILLVLGVDKDISGLVQNYSIIAGVIGFSQNAYVCYFRSNEYRMLLHEQISKIHPRLARILSHRSADFSVDKGRNRQISMVSVSTTKQLVEKQKRLQF
ncbi:unnamed protein product [Caenorhabditis sp. 36 PRJEB53466]|nr:unnamed protein product [Caenorhabditis sp. 36 PRJEB53466]